MSRASPAKGAIRRVGQISRHLGAASPLLADGQNGLKSHGIPLSGVRYIASSAVPPPASNIQGLLTRTEFSAHPRWQTGVKSFFANSIPANTSIEDAWSVQKEAIQGDGELERAYVTVTDGHLGPLAAQVVARYLPSYIAKEFSRMSVVAKTEAKEDADGHDSAIMRKCNAIVSAYKRLDNDICRGGIPAPPDMPVQSLALQGACCISAVVDPEQNGIFVAGAGDCRALIGKRSASGSWEMVEMSRDHTLRDADELQRVLDEHPGEPRHILANQGRVLGSLMPSRAFGDSDFKWDRETQQKLGSTLFPPQIYRSPPCGYHRCVRRPRNF